MSQNFNATVPLIGTAFKADAAADASLIQAVELALLVAGVPTVLSAGPAVAALSLPVVQPLDTTATASITAADAGTTSTVGQNGQVIYSGTPTPGSFFSVAMPSVRTAGIRLSGTWTGTLQTEVSLDGGSTWLMQSLHLIGTVVNAGSFTANGEGVMSVSGKTQVRVRALALASGSPTVQIDTSVNEAAIYVSNKVSPGGTNPTDRSGTIAVGGTGQQLAPANFGRFGYSIYNQSTSATLWVNDVGGVATAGGSSKPIGPQTLYETPPSCSPNAALSIFGATTGMAFTAQEF